MRRTPHLFHLCGPSFLSSSSMCRSLRPPAMPPDTGDKLAGWARAPLPAELAGARPSPLAWPRWSPATIYPPPRPGWSPLRPRAGAPQRRGQPRGARPSPHRSSRGGHGGAPRGRGEARTAAGRRRGSLTPPQLFPLPTLTLGRRSLRLLEQLLGL
jgi:hypothetical protein